MTPESNLDQYFMIYRYGMKSEWGLSLWNMGSFPYYPQSAAFYAS